MTAWNARDVSDTGLDPADYAAGQIPVKSSEIGLFVPLTVAGERLVQDGSAPPVDLTLEDESDYLYEDV